MYWQRSREKGRGRERERESAEFKNSMGFSVLPLQIRAPRARARGLSDFHAGRAGRDSDESHEYPGQRIKSRATSIIGGTGISRRKYRGKESPNRAIFIRAAVNPVSVINMFSLAQRGLAVYSAFSSGIRIPPVHRGRASSLLFRSLARMATNICKRARLLTDGRAPFNGTTRKVSTSVAWILKMLPLTKPSSFARVNAQTRKRKNADERRDRTRPPKYHETARSEGEGECIIFRAVIRGDGPEGEESRGGTPS